VPNSEYVPSVPDLVTRSPSTALKTMGVISPY
jgi:hypothetical protein